MSQSESVWIRIAISKSAIHERRKERWRYFIDPSIESEEVRAVKFEGVVNHNNMLSCSQADPDVREVVGWIHAFGDIEIRSGVAYITLREPQEPPKNLPDSALEGL